ncbi:MAG: T9SS type A sorting domain-containing protein, partial [Bacteroidales bacterium]|nr:T9SS type A sorting domain-containing protein [Bacteroidales bacterium]
ISMNFVLRSADQSKQTEDLFLTVYEPGLTIEITEPSGNLIVKEGDNFQVSAKSIYLGTAAPASLSLYIDDVLTYTSASDTLQHTLSVAGTGKHWIKVSAESGEYYSKDSIFYFVQEELTPADIPAGMQDGINYIGENTVTLVLYAPDKENVFVIGDFNNWELNNNYQLKQTPDGNRWWVTITGLTSGQEYAFQYYIDGNLKIAEPYSEKILDPWNDSYIPESTYPNLKDYPTGKTTGIVSILQTNQPDYEWQVTDFVAPANEDLIIYETHIQNFTHAGTINMLKDSLNYLAQLGINAIELMPVNEFEGNISWGYNPSFYFAFDKTYGTKTDFKEFIDACHEKGIAVIIDMVLNHSFGQSPMVQLYWNSEANEPSADNPWFNQQPTHDYNVGYDMNHENDATKAFCSRVMKFWLKEFNIDGYRFDLAKGFTQNYTLGDVTAWGHYDASRVAIWEQYADTIRSVKDNAYIILEHLADNSEETYLANNGFMLWGNMNYSYNEATMGYNESGKTDFSWANYLNRDWDNPNLVAYMESHDEERLMFKNKAYGNANDQYDVKELETGLQRTEAAAAFFYTIPGPKMLWEWGELGYDYSINTCDDGVTINEGCRLSLKPIKWDYYEIAARYRLFKVFEALFDLKAYGVTNTKNITMNVTGAAKAIYLSKNDTNLAIIGNFDIINQDLDVVFQHTGTWYDYLTGEEIDVTNAETTIKLKPGEYYIYSDVKFEVIDLPAAPEIPSVSGISETELSESISVYPNPVTGGQLNIHCSEAAAGNQLLQLLNTSGQLVFSQEININTGVITIDVSGLNSSLLFYKIISEDYNKQGVIIIE